MTIINHHKSNRTGNEGPIDSSQAHSFCNPLDGRQESPREQHRNKLTHTWLITEDTQPRVPSTGQEHHGRRPSASTLLRRDHNSTTNSTTSTRTITVRDTTAGIMIRAMDHSTTTGTLPREARLRGIPMAQGLAVHREGRL